MVTVPREKTVTAFGYLLNSGLHNREFRCVFIVLFSFSFMFDDGWHLACEKGAWKCVQYLVIARNDEINLIKDEYYPIHQAVLHDQRFLELLIQHGAITTVRTCTQQMTLLHVGE